MHFSNLLASAATVATLASAAAIEKRYTGDSTAGTDQLAWNGLVNLAKYQVTHPLSSLSCNIATAAKRQEWNTLSSSQKQSYINAVLCLQSKPSQISGVPGAVTRYDDFVAVHIQQTLSIHGTGNFLSWHRYFTWAYEQALRNECGYTGYQPYLNWGKLASDPLGAPVFDGSSTSMSGNGAYRNHTGAYIPNAALPFIYLPPGTGGDCVTSGPFQNMVVNLGPVSPVLPYIPSNPGGLGPNPRCLRRDISSIAAAEALTDANSTALISGQTDIIDFQNTMQGNFPAGLLGVHTAGHFLVGGDPGGDLFASPGDPYFFLHHAQIDRTWWIWQNQDLADRQDAIGGTLTLFNDPPSRNTSLADTLYLSVLAPNVTISQVMSTTGNSPLCYIYV